MSLSHNTPGEVHFRDVTNVLGHTVRQTECTTSFCIAVSNRNTAQGKERLRIGTFRDETEFRSVRLEDEFSCAISLAI